MAPKLAETSKNPGSSNMTEEEQDGARPKSAQGQLHTRAARKDEIGMLHQRLMEAIETTADYTDEFRAYEKKRLSIGYLQNLHRIDPHHLLTLIDKGQMVGFMISGPELGTLWLYWSYSFPEVRRATHAMALVPMFVEHWDNGRFHKISTYSLASNKVAQKLMTRFRFQHTCTLKQHIFGQDFMLWERFLTKKQPGYDFGMPRGRLARLAQKLNSIFSR